MGIISMRMTNLTALNLCKCTEVSDSSMGFAIKACTQLRELHLERTQAADTTMYAIAMSPGAPYLRTLDLSNCPNINDGLMASVLGTCTNLRALSLSCNANVTDSSVIRVPTCLQRLLLDRCPGITDRAVITVIEKCPNLTDLDVSGNAAVTDTALQSLLKHGTSLQRLDLRGCPVSGALTERLKTLVGGQLGDKKGQ
mmetsp:Transcript_39785/g.97775  ORF Transcript_39785/g.97775 Transcript_39785/m.97775 type:complete len:198 (+) Transcript_39785:78-671(+)